MSTPCALARCAAAGDTVPSIAALNGTAPPAFSELSAYRGAVTQLLSSGAAPTAEEGAELLAQLVTRWRLGEGIEPLVGSGVHAGNLAALHRRIGARQYHVGSGARIGGSFASGIDAARIAALRQAL